MAFATLCTVGLAAFSPASLAGMRAPTTRAAVLRMFEDPSEATTEKDVTITSVTRSREVGSGRTGTIVVTDGSDSFYHSRAMFGMLHDFGRYASIVASSSSAADAKKMLLSRNARYSGLLDVLGFHEGEAASAFEGADSWLAIGPDETTLSASIDAAAAAGVKRVFLLLSAAIPDGDALEAQLSGHGIEYTVMRTGSLVNGDGGSGLKLGDLDQPVCEDVPREDVFRFVTEALTLPEANARAFSLCPSVATESSLKQMRLAGYERRDEVQLLLQGVLKEQKEAKADMTEEEAEAEAELVMRSEAEVAAEREEELRTLLARARQRGVETQERLAFEEKEKLAWRKEQERYYSKPPGGDDETDGDSPPADDSTPDEKA